MRFIVVIPWYSNITFKEASRKYPSFWLYELIFISIFVVVKIAAQYVSINFFDFNIAQGAERHFLPPSFTLLVWLVHFLNSFVMYTMTAVIATAFWHGIVPVLLLMIAHIKTDFFGTHD